MSRQMTALCLVLVAGPGQSTTLCGWLDNPTPGNFWLRDRAREWTLATQGGPEVPGIDRMPDMSTRGWVETNGPHGYGCACLTVRLSADRTQIAELLSATPMPLRRCRADRHLPRP